MNAGENEHQSSPPHRARLLVFLSGSGRTLANLFEHINNASLNASIELVVSNRPCIGLDIADDHSVATEIIDGSPTADQLDTRVREHAIDWIILAGYLKLVPITPLTQGRIVNIHPSLLPAFGGPGMHGLKVHTAAIEAAKQGKITESGCTVHFADEQYDTGKIILQRRCPIHPTDTPSELAARVFELECQAFPEALRTLIN
ncbi:MAG: phosphoribosylglycinamide formyltransferase [Phycisphaerales bacterium]